MSDHEKNYNVGPYVINVFPIISENIEVVYVYKILYEVSEFGESHIDLRCIYVTPMTYLTENSATEAAIKYMDVMLVQQMDSVDKLYDRLFPNKI